MSSRHLFTLSCLLAVLSGCQITPLETPPAATPSDLPKPAVPLAPAAASTGTPVETPRPGASVPGPAASPLAQPGPSPSAAAVASARLVLQADTRYLDGVDAQGTLRLQAFDAAGQPLDPARLKLEWRSSRPQDIRVDASGRLQAIEAYGYSLISVRDTVSGVEASLQISVVGNDTGSSAAAPVLPLPVLEGLSLRQGPAGLQITLSGSGFGALASANSVRFGSRIALITAASPTSLTVTVPNLPAGSYMLSVSSPGGSSRQLQSFTITPVLSKVTEEIDSIGSSVVLSGTGFALTPADNHVRFGSTDATVTAATSDALTVTVPAGLSGSQTLHLSVGDAPASGTPTFTVRPVLTAVAPAAASVGNTVTLTGSGFALTPADNHVRFGSTDATVTAATATQLTVTVPAGLTGEVAISLRVGDQTAVNRPALTITPLLTGSTPAAAIIGSTITLSGSGFSPTAADNHVLFGSTAATVTAATSEALTLNVPAGISGNQTLHLSVGSLTATGTPTFAVKPAITDVNPAGGVTGTVVTLTGSGFDTTALNNTVLVGLRQATVQGTPSNTSLTLKVNGQSLDYGAQNVTVQVGTQTSAPGTFTQQLTSPCVVSGFTPPTGDPLFFYDCLDAAPTGTAGVDYSNVVQTPDRFGHAGKAYRFNGTDSFRQISGVDIGPAGHPQLTLSAWAQLPAVPASGVYSVVGQDNTPFDRALMLDNRSPSGFGWSAFAGSKGVIGIQAANANQWVMLTAVYDQTAQTVAFYVNDTLIQSVTNATLTAGTSYLMLGKNATPTASEFFPGDVDDLLVFGKALSAADVAELYTRTKP